MLKTMNFKLILSVLLALVGGVLIFSSCETAQNVATLSEVSKAQNTEAQSILNNWNFATPVRNEQQTAPFEWWIWEASRYGAGSGKVSHFGVEDGYAFISVADPGSETWHIQFNQWVKLAKNQAYYISFKAKADAAKRINLKILQTHEPWANYLAKTVDLTTEWRTYEFYYFHKENADETVTFGFELGKTEATTVYFSEVVLKPIDKSQLPPEEQPVEEEAFEYEFEDEEEPENLVNNGDFAYKIINDQQSMPFEWWIWQASQYGISPAKIAGYGVENGVGFVVVEHPGSETWHVQFNQWIKIRRGGKYIITFRAKADVPRPLTVKLVQTGAPYGVFFSQTVELIREWKTFEFEYTHPEKGDPVVTLSFELGKETPTTIYFDDIAVKPVSK